MVRCQRSSSETWFFQISIHFYSFASSLGLGSQIRFLLELADVDYEEVIYDSNHPETWHKEKESLGRKITFRVCSFKVTFTKLICSFFSRPTLSERALHHRPAWWTNDQDDRAPADHAVFGSKARTLSRNRTGTGDRRTDRIISLWREYLLRALSESMNTICLTAISPNNRFDCDAATLCTIRRISRRPKVNGLQMLL